jgi:phosphoglucomutase
MNELAGKAVPESMYLDIPALVSGYYTGKPDPAVPEQRVVF